MASASQQLSYPVIDTELYLVLVRGDISGFETAIARNQVNVVELRCASVNKKTVLHIAASAGQVDMVDYILSNWSKLMLEKNSEGDLAIHAALKSGKLRSVKALIRWLKEKKEIGDQVFGWKNNNGEGSTPLHIALEFDQEETAKELVELYPCACYAMNSEGICPLYLAIKKEFANLVKHMLDKLKPFKVDALATLSQGKSILHAAVYDHKREMLSLKKKEILEAVLSYDSEELIKLTDTQGWTALSYAACNGSLEIVKVFQEKVPHNIFLNNKDKDMSFPIHVAIHEDNTNIINLLASTWSLVDAKYQNILHIAALTGCTQIVSLVLIRSPKDEGESLINQKDECGNTPLHLATLAKCVDVVHLLIQDERVNIKLSNKEGMTAKDLAKNLMFTNPDDKGVQKLYLMLERATKGLRNHQIDSDLYRHLVNEAIDEVLGIVSKIGVHFEDLLSLEDGNNVLHFVAYMDNPTPFIDKVIASQDCTILMKQANMNGDLPIHSAAKAGKLQNLQTLFQDLCFREEDRIYICAKQNINGNTALHEAVLNGHGEIAKDLYLKYKTAAYCLNKDNVCPLFLVIKNWRDHRDLVKEMITGMKGNEDSQNRLKDAKSVIHMAILARRMDILKLTMDTAPRLVDSFDSRGRSPLSYAAYIGYVKGVSLLLKHDPNLELKCDKDTNGSFPIHNAVKGGQLKVMKLLTLSEILVNNNEQNALHVAAELGRVNVVDYLLERPKIKGLINIGDVNGNTPLHLAVKGSHHRSVHRLVKEKHINSNLTNKELLTAKDVFQRYHDPQGQSYNPKIIYMYLLLKQSRGKNSIVRERGDDKQGEKKAKEDGNSSSKPSTWQIANMLLVVATLMIGMSFNAILNPPGGYNKNTGLPAFSTLSSKDGFQYKAFSNTIFGAFYFSVTAALFLLAAAMIEKNSKLFLAVGALFIYVGLISMTISCMAGMYAIDRSLHTRDTTKFLEFNSRAFSIVALSTLVVFEFALPIFLAIYPHFDLKISLPGHEHYLKEVDI